MWACEEVTLALSSRDLRHDKVKTTVYIPLEICDWFLVVSVKYHELLMSAWSVFTAFTLLLAG